MDFKITPHELSVLELRKIRKAWSETGSRAVVTAEMIKEVKLLLGHIDYLTNEIRELYLK